MRGIFPLRACCSLLLLIPTLAFPQSSKQSTKKDYALIYGTVWGPDERPVAGVPISIRRASDRKPKWELTSDHSGEFAQRVPAGTQDYVIEAGVKTSKGHSRPQITVHVDDDERRDVGLHLTQEELSPR